MARDTCLCGIDVTTATKFTGWIYLIVKLVSFFGLVYDLWLNVSGNSKISPYVGQESNVYLSAVLTVLLLELIAIVCTCFLLMGVYNHNPSFYHPFLIYSFLAFLLLLFAATFHISKWFYTWLNQDGVNNDDLILSVILGPVSLIWFYMGYVIPQRSRKELSWMCHRGDVFGYY